MLAQYVFVRKDKLKIDQKFKKGTKPTKMTSCENTSWTTNVKILVKVCAGSQYVSINGPSILQGVAQKKIPDC